MGDVAPGLAGVRDVAQILLTLGSSDGRGAAVRSSVAGGSRPRPGHRDGLGPAGAGGHADPRRMGRLLPVTGVDRLLLASQTGPGRGSTRHLAALLVIPGLSDRVAYLRAMAWPHADYLRGSGGSTDTITCGGPSAPPPRGDNPPRSASATTRDRYDRPDQDVDRRWSFPAAPMNQLASRTSTSRPSLAPMVGLVVVGAVLLVGAQRLGHFNSMSSAPSSRSPCSWPWHLPSQSCSATSTRTVASPRCSWRRDRGQDGSGRTCGTRCCTTCTRGRATPAGISHRAASSPTSSRTAAMCSARSREAASSRSSVAGVHRPSAESARRFRPFSWVAFLGLILFSRAIRIALPTADHRRYDLLLFFLPTLVFWPSSIGKEAWMVAMLGLASYGAARLFTHRVSGLVPFGLGIVGASVVRPHMALMILAALGPAWLVRPSGRNRLGLSPFVRAIGFAVLIVVLLAVVSPGRDLFRHRTPRRRRSRGSWPRTTRTQTGQGDRSSRRPGWTPRPTSRRRDNYPVPSFLWEAGNTQGLHHGGRGHGPARPDAALVATTLALPKTMMRSALCPLLPRVHAGIHRGLLELQQLRHPGSPTGPVVPVLPRPPHPAGLSVESEDVTESPARRVPRPRGTTPYAAKAVTGPDDAQAAGPSAGGMTEGPGPSPTIGRRQRVLQWAEAHRGPLTALTDALVWPLALTFSCWLRYEFSFSPWTASISPSSPSSPPASRSGSDGGRGSTPDAGASAASRRWPTSSAASAITTVVVFGVNLVPDPHLVPSGAMVISGLVALVTMGGVRYGWRLYARERRAARTHERANGP